MLLPTWRCSSLLKSSVSSSTTRRLLRGLHHATKRKLVFGIETSCDDTGMAVVDETGNILGEAHHSQLETHLRLGGILPPLAANLHRQNLEKVQRDTFSAAGIQPHEIDVVAVTNRPGLSLSLSAGLEHAKRFCKENSLPLIPIHHMQAHALVVRCGRPVDFPYLVLLVSGGHCQVAVAKDVTDFTLLGTTLDDAPGEAFDKIARRLKLSNLRECRNISGGASIELLAKRGNPTLLDYKQPLTTRRDCSFSFSGFKSKSQSYTEFYEKQFGIEGDGVLPNVADICASVQYYMCLHLMKRVWRAILYCRQTNIDFGDRLVISGGVACSTYLRMFMKQLCEQEHVELIVPPAHLCSDNGVMIAWNGMERFLAGEKPIPPDEVDKLSYSATGPLGVDITDQVWKANISTPRFKIDMARLLEETGNVFADKFVSKAEQKRRRLESAAAAQLEKSENTKDAT